MLAEEIAPQAVSIDIYKTMLARSLAQMVNVFDPGVIVFGGGLSELDGLATDIGRRMARYGFSHEEGRTRVVKAQHGNASGALGACWLWDGVQA